MNSEKSIKILSNKMKDSFASTSKTIESLRNILLQEIQEKDFDKTVEKLFTTFISKDSYSYQLKIALAGITVSVSLVWAANGGLVKIAHSESEGISNAEAINADYFAAEGTSSMNAVAINRYQLKIPEEHCEEGNGSKKSFKLCGKDDEQELERIKKEELAAKAKAAALVKPKARGPMPYVYEKDSLGRRVCNKKNDHPGKSNQNKNKHMDMECCLDPDEVPNPNCYYDPKKYGKYL